jgi:AcrR family transcriptional regulator
VPNSTARSPGRPPRLHFEQVIDAAATLIEAEGTAALTMRRVAEACGVTTMALYRHVRTKDDLIALVANRAIDQFQLPAAGSVDWRDELTSVVTRMHEFLLEHPEFASIFASRPIDSVVAYRAIERILAALKRAGLDDDSIVASYDLLISFIRGFAQQHTGPRARANSPLRRISVIRDLSEEEFEHVIRLGERLVSRDPRAGFAEELAILIEGIESRVERSKARRRRDGA